MRVHVSSFLGLYSDCSYKYTTLNVDDITVYAESGAPDVNKIYS